MSQHFEVGEVAIYWRPEAHYHGEEVTIKSSLTELEFWDFHAGKVTEPGHKVDAPFLKGYPANFVFCVALKHLRKRRPPQDWVKLCELDKLPADAVPA